MKKQLILTMLAISSITSFAQSKEKPPFMEELLTAKPGGKSVLNSEGKDLSKLKDSTMCDGYFSWGQPVYLDKTLQKQKLYICKSNYFSEFDTKLKTPTFTIEVLDVGVISQLDIYKKIEKNKYLENIDLPSAMYLSPKSLLNSDYELTPMAPSIDMFTVVYQLKEEDKIEKLKSTMELSYLISNQAPMNKTLRSGLWNKIENYAKQLVIEKSKIIVSTGPLYLTEEKNINNTVIPSHFFKTITDAYTHGTVSFVVPNKAIDCNSGCNLNNYVVSFQELEKLGKFTLYSKLAPIYAAKIKLDEKLLN